MKKLFFAVLSITIGIMSFLVVLAQSPPTVFVDDNWAGTANGTNIGSLVYGTNAFATISEGIDAAQAGIYMRVFVYNGNYAENNFNIFKQGLVIEGETKDGVVLVAPPVPPISPSSLAPDYVFGIFSNGVRISNMSIIGDNTINYAVFGEAAQLDNTSISDLIVSRFVEAGISLSSTVLSNSAVVNNTKVSYCTNGISLRNINNALISHNLVENTVIGILHKNEFDAQSTIIYNDVKYASDIGYDLERCNTGLSVFYYNNALFTLSSISTGVKLTNCGYTEDESFVLNKIENAQIGIDIIGNLVGSVKIGAGNKIYGKYIEHNSSKGIQAQSSSTNSGSFSVLACEFKGWDNAVYLNPSTNQETSINETVFINNCNAVYISGAYSKTDIHNCFVESCQAGIVKTNTSPVDASSNWWGTNDYKAIRQLFPNGFGGIDYSPWFWFNTNNKGEGYGFKGDYSEMGVDAASIKTGGIGHLTEASDIVTHSVVYAALGTYNEQLSINKSVTIVGLIEDGIKPIVQCARSKPVINGALMELTAVIMNMKIVSLNSSLN